MTVEKMNFLNEEIIVKREKLKVETDPFSQSMLPHEKDSYGVFRVIKIGEEQKKVKVGDLVLINQNGLNKEITIENVGIITDTYAIMNHQRLFAILND